MDTEAMVGLFVEHNYLYADERSPDRRRAKGRVQGVDRSGWVLVKRTNGTVESWDPAMVRVLRKQVD